MTEFPAIDPASPASRPTRPRPLLIYLASAAIVCAALCVLFLFGDSLGPPAERRAEGVVPVEAIEPAAAPLADASAEPETTVSASHATLIDDDGTTVWASPTDGLPLDLAYLPPGVQIVLAIRPATLVEHPEGAKVLAALGPLGQRGIQFVEQATGRSFASLDQLLVGWQTGADDTWEVALVARERTEERGARSELPESHAAWQRYEPPAEKGRVIVVASPTAIHDIKTLAGQAPPLRRDMQRLVAGSDSARDVTLLVTPSFLFGDGHTLFAGEAARLREPLFWFLGDGLGAVSLGMHWDENFFVEFRAVPSLDALPDRTAEALLDRVHELPDRVEDYVVGLNPQPYGRRVVARFPEMVRKLVNYTRATYDGREAILRCYLPAVAGHNLLLGAELTLAESPTQNPSAASPSSASPLQSLGTRRGERAGAPLSVAERLQKRTSLRFPRDTLEAALEMLADDTGVEIILLGRDLQLDGITKNQSFGIDLADRPAREILVEILRLANPDKSAAGPADGRQKLVYVIKPRELGGPEAVWITTRSQARQRGDRLPDVFIRHEP